jgi:hypothetical protein
MLPDDRDRLGWSHIVSRCPTFFTRNAVEVLFDDLLAPGESIATAHEEIITDQVTPTTTTVSTQLNERLHLLR